MRVLSIAFVLSSLAVTAGCDADSPDRELVAGGLTMAPATPTALDPAPALVEEAPAPAPAPRPRRTSVARAPRTETYAEPAYRPQPVVVKQTHIKRDAAIGAGVGAGVGAIVHDRNRVKGAIVGGVIGGAAGAVVGATIDKSERVVYY